MPVFAVIGAVIAKVVSVGAAVIGTVGGAIGAALATKAGVAVAGGMATALVTGAIAKRQAGKALTLQEETALRDYELGERALDIQEESIKQDAITGTLAAEKAAVIEKEAVERVERESEESKVLSAKAQQIETLANLKQAQLAYRQPPPQPIYYSTPQPVSQQVGIFDTINTAIHRFFGSWG